MLKSVSVNIKYLIRENTFEEKTLQLTYLSEAFIRLSQFFRLIFFPYIKINVVFETHGRACFLFESGETIVSILEISLKK